MGQQSKQRFEDKIVPVWEELLHTHNVKAIYVLSSDEFRKKMSRYEIRTKTSNSNYEIKAKFNY